MNLSTAILGKSIVTQLQARGSAPVLVIGADTFTRPQLSKIGCFNFVAAARLSTVVKALGVKDTADLFHRIPPSHLAIPGLGAICLATIGAAFEVKRLGTLADYVARHGKRSGDPVVTFATMKTNRRDAAAVRAEKKTARERKHRRRDAAQEIRVERHLQRTH